MSATSGVDPWAIFGTAGAWLASFFNQLVQYMPLIISVGITAVLIYKYFNVIRRAVGQLVNIF
ncbi:MAG: hypothetical protein JHC26_12685 [Thermofilum sp.]|jgi:divalent metal cation (Fe/Co/Zn/Cd) transporter|uniref:hypothetical protein n=1 Tax=Thermofilum sp. TaxID=1961369 RepID=UPI00258BCFB5|nr:hypothetical protein [Thermofilum sp.]MCI4409942.1 hypothetical protein [Thermofilum sp.]